MKKTLPSNRVAARPGPANPPQLKKYIRCHWYAILHTSPMLESFARPLYVAEETAFTPEYAWYGRTRKREHHCFFKYTLQGYGLTRYGNKDYTVGEGQGFLCHVNDPRGAYGYDPAHTEPWHYIFLSFTNADALTHELIDRYGPVYTVPKTSALIRSLLNYRRFAGSSAHYTPGEAAHIVYGLLAMLADTAGFALPKQAASHALVTEALRLIHARVDQPEPHGVTDLARELAVSPAHLARLFQTTIGLTPRHYMTREKIRLACQLLRDTDLSGKEIYLRLGYDTASHFARAFTRISGVSPQEFRRQKGLVVF